MSQFSQLQGYGLCGQPTKGTPPYYAATGVSAMTCRSMCAERRLCTGFSHEVSKESCILWMAYLHSEVPSTAGTWRGGARCQAHSWECHQLLPTPGHFKSWRKA